MKRLFLILLLAVLPFQISWAAVASYCQHEEAPSTQHFGHHAHKHQASSQAPDDKGSPAKVDNDCEFCHVSCMKSMLVQPVGIALSQASTHNEFLPPIYSSHIPKGPERPKLHPAS